jgi:hypothetical protein
MSDDEVQDWGGSPHYADYRTSFSQAPGISDNSLSTIASNMLHYHEQQIHLANITKPMNIKELKDTLRLFHETHSVNLFDFLVQSTKTDKTFAKLVDICSRLEYNQLPIKNTVEEMILDTDLTVTKEFIAAKIVKDISSIECPIEMFKEQMRRYFTLWKETVEELNMNTMALTCKVEKYESIFRKTQILEILPENENLVPLIEASLEYLKKEFETAGIENEYNNLINSYKKLYVLKDIIRGISTLLNDQHLPLCVVCYENAIDSVLVPCGHTFCSSCIKPVGLLNRIACHICRTYSTNIQKIYFS